MLEWNTKWLSYNPTTHPSVPIFMYVHISVPFIHLNKRSWHIETFKFCNSARIGFDWLLSMLQYCSSLDRPLTAEFYYKFIYWIPKSGTKDTLTCEFLCPKIFKVKNKNFYWLVKKIMIICQLKRNCYHYIQVTISMSIKNKTRFSVLAGKIQLDGRWRSHLVEFYQPEPRILFCFYKNSSRSIDLELFLFK